MAEAMEPGDRIVLYLTRVQAFAASLRLVSPNVRGSRAGLARQARRRRPVPVALRGRARARARRGGLAARRGRQDDLEHIRKWPAEHWTLAFQGQLRTVSEHDARVLLDAMAARLPAGATPR